MNDWPEMPEYVFAVQFYLGNYDPGENNSSNFDD